MKKQLITVFFLLLTINSFGQQYNTNSICGTDTIFVDHIHRLTGSRIYYKAFECTQVSKLGIRFDIGFNTYIYNTKTRLWLGNHKGATFGLVFAYQNFNLGFYFKPATVSPKSEFIFNGDTLSKNALLNPVKIEYDFSYSINFKNNFSIEPYIGFVINNFYVINEQDLNKTYKIPNSSGMIAGVGINKYFKLKELEFMSLFVKCGYGLTDFKRTNHELGKGYSDWAIGLSYKAFYKRKFLKHIQ